MTKSTRSAYKNQAKTKLEHLFPRISCAAINIVFASVDFRFPEAFRILKEIQKEYPNGDGRTSFPALPATIKVFLKNEREPKKPKFYVRHQKLQQEIASIHELNDQNKENEPRVVIPRDPDAVEEAKEEEVLVECGCCYGDYKPEEIKVCSNTNAGHHVCKSCLNRYVSEQLDGKNSVEFKCIIDQQCGHAYHATLLDAVLSPRLKKRKDDRVFREDIKKAGLNAWYVNIVGVLFSHVCSFSLFSTHCT